MPRTHGLTVAERTIMHLSAFSHQRDTFVVPADVTQDGVASRLGISRPHAAISLRSLLEKGLVETRLSHIVGYPWRKKAYFLTRSGEERNSLIKDRAKQFGPVEILICGPTPAKSIPRPRISVADELEDLRRRVAALEARGA